jgi:formylmethanofuran dehydrogenase subunit A
MPCPKLGWIGKFIGYTIVGQAGIPILPTKHPHGFLSAKLAAIRQVAARLQPHFRKIGDNALLLTVLGNVFAVRRYKKGGDIEGVKTEAVLTYLANLLSPKKASARNRLLDPG